jgi:hypothetical protein
MRYDEAKIDEAVLAESRHDRAAPDKSGHLLAEDLASHGRRRN